MKNTYKIIIIFLILAFLLKLGFDFFSKPTPLEYATSQSGLNLPKTLKLIKFEENWENANGDGSRFIEYDLSDKDIVALKGQCVTQNYSLLPVKENGYNPFSSKKLDEGYYKIKFTSEDDRSHELTIVDLTRKKLYITLEVL